MNLVTNRTRQKWIDQIKKVSSDIDSSYNFTCMDQYIKDKRIVLLGESSHGVGEYYTTKIKMIKYLHEKHGFNVVVFESGLLEGVLCKLLLNDKSPKEQIRHCLLDIFHNEEMVPLFEDSWAQELELAGMDIQPTYPTVSNELLLWIHDNIDTELHNTLEKIEKRFFEIDEEIRGQPKISKTVKKEISECIERYQSSLEVIERKIGKEANQEKLRMLNLILRGIHNRIKWMEINLQSFIASGVQRGTNMFNNLKWLLEEYYADEKVIVWAHNFHIRKEKTITSKLFKLTNVGQLLKEYYSEQIYSIGLYAGKGKFSSLLRVGFPVDTSKKKHLENILLEGHKGDCFLPLCNKELPKRNWLNRRWWLLEAGMMGQLPIAIYPNKHYDAIMFCGEVNPPNYFTGND